jgi:hypothetical protein
MSFLTWVETKAFRMIRGPTERIRRSVAYNIYTGGGLGIFHVLSRIAAFRVKHLATFISCREKPWVAFADYCIRARNRSSRAKRSIRVQFWSTQSIDSTSASSSYAKTTTLRRSIGLLVTF